MGGRLLVSSGDEPSITGYRIDDEMSWQELDTVSFAEYPLTDNANLFYQYLVDERHMYMPFETVKRIVWDPTKLEIKTTMEDSVMEVRQGALSLEHAGNRSGTRYEDSDTLVPFFYHDDDWYDFGEVSFIAVYDRKTHKEKKVLEAPCPGLAITSRDEGENTYFSTYDYGPIRPLAGLGPKPCVVRVTPDLELDETFTTDLTSLTDGRVVTNFRYIRDGWGLGNVFHAERSDVDFTSEEVPAEAFDEAWNDKNWSVWFFDLENGEARPFDEIEVPSFGWTTTAVDGRLFLNVPYDSGAKTKFYELDERGGLREHLDVVGDAAFIKIR